MKGPSQTLARKLMNAFRRNGWASLLDVVKPCTVARDVLGAGMERMDVCVTKGDLDCSLAVRQTVKRTVVRGEF